MVVFFRAILRRHSEKKFTAKDFHSISSHANINHSVILARSTDKNAAGSQHLDSLLDEHTFIRLGHAVGHHPCGGTTGGGACGRVFSVVKQHAGVQAGREIDRLPGYEIEKLAVSGAPQILARGGEIHLQAAA